VAWRRFLIKRLRFFSTFRILDLATGTGDVAIGAAQAYPSVKVMALDFVSPMLEAAGEKINRTGLGKRVGLVRGDALKLPFPDGSFDAVTMAFGIRNIPDREQVFREMIRVLVPGGRIYILEMSSPQNRVFRALYLPYLNHVLPRLARRFSKDPAAYLYLAESILHFPHPKAFSAEIEGAGFLEVKAFTLTLGITYLHEGTKPF
jgi:demethylmenaquinone methyltransferase / 2-methoxy-6-polyprenyl-1,4-benzoquinol methylase